MKPSLFIYLSPYDILRPRTNQVSDVRFCDGFVLNNKNVHLIVPFVYRKDNINKDDVFKVYGINKELNIHYLNTFFRNDVNGKLNTLLVSFLCYLTILKIIFKEKNFKINIISRSVPLLAPSMFFRSLFKLIGKKINIIHWAHDLKKRKNYLNFYKKCNYILATNNSILTDLIELTGYNRTQTCITSNPITEKQANEPIDKVFSKKLIGLIEERPLIVYTGKLAIDYNQETIFILKAASTLPKYSFLFTGGKPEAVNYWKNYCKLNNIDNCEFTGYINDYQKIIHYQRAADVLISYYTKQGHDVKYNLPNKLVEYMLSGNVIVTPDYPATKDILNSTNCIFTSPENSTALANAIEKAINDKETSKQLARQARLDASQNTFTNSTKRVIQLIDNEK